MNAEIEEGRKCIAGKYHGYVLVYLILPRLIFCFCSELRKQVSEETAAKEALQAVYASAQRDYDDLEEATVAACQAVEGEGGASGSSLGSHLRSLGD